MNSDVKQRIEQINRGEVPEGYKKTAVGIVPQEWEETQLSKIFVFKNGLNKEKKAFGSGTPIVNYVDVWKKRGIKAKDVTGRVMLSEKEIENYNVKKGDVFFTRTSETKEEIGLSSVMLDDIENAVFSGFVLRARPVNKKIYTPYNQYCYSSKSMRYEVIRKSSITTRALTSGSSLGKVHINLPSIEEQQRIADILSKWDEAIELQEKLIEKLELQKKALMQRLLTPKEDWKKVKLGDLAFMQSGGTPKSTVGKYYNGNIVWVSINDISSCGKYLSDSERKITVEGLNNSSARLFPKGTVLYAMYASIGKCCIALSECSTSQAILGITTNENLNSEYLYYFLLHNQEKIVTQGQKGTQSNLNKEMVQNIKVDIPQTINQQITIVKILNSVDRYIDSQSEKLKVLKQQQKTMQQLLLTGIVRV